MIKVNVTGLVNLEQLADRIAQVDGKDISRVVALGILPAIRERIHDEGKASDGGYIGNYDTTKPLYVNPTTSPGTKFPAVGKSGRAKFANGEPHKTGYFDSYADYKKATGRDTLGGKANLFLSGGLSNQLTVLGTADGWGLGWPDEKKKKQAEGLEKHFGKKIYLPTQEEEVLINDYAIEALNDVIR